MNENDAFDQSVADLVANEGATGVPIGAVDELITATSRVRPLPRWLALIKEPPMRRSSAVAVGSPTVRLAAIALSTVLLLVLAGGVVAGAMQLIGPATHVVSSDGSGDFLTISAAVDAAEDGDRILVKPGRYPETVELIGKDVEIRGDGPIDTVVVEAVPTDLVIPDFDEEDMVAFYFEDTASTVAELTIGGPDDSWAVVVHGGSATPTLENLSIPSTGGTDEWGRNLLWADGASGTLSDSSVVGHVSMGVDAAPTLTKNSLDACIWIEGEGARPILDSNDIYGCAQGVLVMVGDGWSEYSLPASAEIRGNTFQMETVESGQHVGNFALLIGRSDEPVVIEQNEFIGNKTAIAVRSFAMADISDNTIRDGETGVWVEGEGSTITENRIVGNDLYGLLIHASPSVAANTIEGNLIGINLGARAQPALDGNTFCDNETDLSVPEDNTTTLDGNEVCGSAG